MVLFIPLLNSSIKSYPLYPLSLVAFLNFYTNFSIIFPPCSTLFNSANLTVFSSPPLNFFFIFAKNFLVILYSNNLASKSSNIFSFHTSTDFPYIYDKIHCICSSITSPLILILMYNLHAVINPETFSELSSNTCGLATSLLDPVLGLDAVSSSYTTKSAWT